MVLNFDLTGQKYRLDFSKNMTNVINRIKMSFYLCLCNKNVFYSFNYAITIWKICR